MTCYGCMICKKDFDLPDGFWPIEYVEVKNYGIYHAFICSIQCAEEAPVNDSSAVVWPNWMYPL